MVDEDLIKEVQKLELRLSKSEKIIEDLLERVSVLEDNKRIKKVRFKDRISLK